MPPPRRHRPSTIDKLDPQIRELIGQLRIDKGYTIDEIRAQLEKMLAEEHVPSRSALARHVKSLEEIGAQLRQSREVAQALIAQVGDAPEDRVADLNIELMHSMILRLVTATDDEGDGRPIIFTAEDTMFLTRSLQSLASAKKTNAEIAFKIRKEVTAEQSRKLDEAGRNGELDPAALARAKRILGFGE